MNKQVRFAKWFKPYFEPKRFKGLKGGRGSAKSHHFAGALVIKHCQNPELNSVCIREIQKSLKFSAKKLIEDKIREFGVSHLFDITLNEIRRIDGKGNQLGVMIFQGMQDHTADSIKSLEGFDIAWIEEAQTISRRSIELLVPTIRKQGSEIWASWNPDDQEDPIEVLFNEYKDDALLKHINYLDNPYMPDELLQEAERHRVKRPETYDHVWLGAFRTISDAQIFKDKFEIKEFEIDFKFGEPLQGLDFGFSQDPTAGVRLYIKDNSLYIRKEFGKVGLELDDTVDYIRGHIFDFNKYACYADSARPESISYLNRHGMPMIRGVEKWAGSVEDGIEFIKSFDNIYIHPECVEIAREFRLYSYKVDKRTGEILPKIEDKNNHYIDAIRYALSKLIRGNHSYDYSELL